MPAVTVIHSTGDTYIDGLLGNLKWAVNDFSYSFPRSASLYGTSYGYGETATFGALTSVQQATTRTALSMFASVANLTFTEIAETTTVQADLRFGLSNLPSTAWAYFPTTADEGGDAWFNKSSGAYSKPLKGNYAFLTFIHEIGHALGLEHPHEAGLPADRDSMEYTVMSYRSYINASTTAGYPNETWGYAQSLMMLDIAALQHLYGADYSTKSAGTVYTWSASTGEMFVDGVGQGAPGGNRILLTIWDGGGSDTYDLSNYGTGLKVDLRPGNWTTTATGQLAKLHYDGSRLAAGNIANALLHQGDTRSLIENAVGGTGADVIVGNQAANTLKGNAGNDRLDGGTGSDTAVFGSRRSEYDVTLLADGSLQVSGMRTGAPDGTDITLNIEMFQFSDRTYALAELTAAEQTVMSEPPIVEVVVEEPLATDKPPATDQPPVSVDPLVKQDLALTGTGAADRLKGEAGNDAIYGQGGHDVLIGGSGGDILDGGAGMDTASYATAGAGVRADLMTTSRNTRDAAGDRYASIENLTGSAYVDVLKGNNAANKLAGGSGSDDLYGRGGSDRLDGASGNDDLEGGAGADILYGRSGRDTLYGGSGVDVLSGGTGADLFVFKSRNETASGARDIIQDFVSGTDKIHLRGIDANTKISGNQAFSFIGGNAFTAKAGQLKFHGGVLSGDINGDAVTDFQIRLPKVLFLKSTDFYL
jgi:serralysin